MGESKRTRVEKVMYESLVIGEEVSKMKEKLAKLIDVKSIVTVRLTVIFCILAFKQTITSTEFMTIFTLVISFYFNRQKESTGTTKDTTTKESEE